MYVQSLKIKFHCQKKKYGNMKFLKFFPFFSKKCFRQYYFQVFMCKKLTNIFKILHTFFHIISTKKSVSDSSFLLNFRNYFILDMYYCIDTENGELHFFPISDIKELLATCNNNQIGFLSLYFLMCNNGEESLKFHLEKPETPLTCQSFKCEVGR